MKISQMPKNIRNELLLPFNQKLKRTNEIVKIFSRVVPEKRFCVSCSFGKDSVVVVYLMKQLVPDVQVVFNNTHVQPPETYKFKTKLTDEWNLNLIETHPYKQMSFWKLADKFGLPDGKKKTDNCCDYLKLKPTKLLCKEKGIRQSFTGITILESFHRSYWICQRGQAYYSRRDDLFKIHPIAYWTEEEIWGFIHENSLPYNPLYDRGYKRLGCATCTSYKDWQKQMKTLNPKMYEYLIRRYMS